MAQPNMKPYVKLASSLVLVGTGLFSAEQFILGRIEGNSHSVHIDAMIWNLMILVPLGLVAAGALVFVLGKMRRL